jgi:hypothetical protein
MWTQGRRRRTWATAVTLAAGAVALAGCGSGEPDETDPVQQRDRVASPDAPDTGGRGDSGTAASLVAGAVAAWQSNDSDAFVTLLDEAADTCAEPSAARRLAEVTAIGQRWASALADGRPKVQATTEEQLSALDWDALAAACSQP